ncbi:MAG: nitroreductase [Chloroflexi bacterium]|nr:nitroreductase [Chloroflexota bacterium]
MPADGIAKTAKMEHRLHPLIAERWSPRAFSERPVPTEILQSVLEAARWAPSASNQQPWHFLIATNDDPRAFQHLLGILRTSNSRWAQHVPVLMLVLARLYQEYEGHPPYRSLYEVGLAVGMLTLQATAHGLAVHQMGGFYPDKARANLDIPEDHLPVVAVALGYPGDPARLPEDLRAREAAPRTRRPLADLISGAGWQTTSPLATRPDRAC